MGIGRVPSVVGAWTEALRLKVADSLFHNASEGICVTDACERIIEVNPTFCRICGYTRSELIGETPRVMASGLQDELFFAKMWSDLKSSGAWHGDIWNRKKTGELFAARVNVSAITDAAGGVTHYLAIMADVTTMKVQELEWEKGATHDALTGLPNRHLLADRLVQAMAHSLRTGLLLAICYLDLDRFKPINDLYGHEAGDAVLIDIAARLNRSVREGDTVARVGGDEFVLLLWGLEGIPECNSTLNRVLSEIRCPLSIGCQAAQISGSVGVALFPRNGTDSVLLTAQADSAMYRSKLAGGDRLTYFGQPSQPSQPSQPNLANSANSRAGPSAP